jgi:predicted GIY-YIG superfamily endonuclease
MTSEDRPCFVYAIYDGISELPFYIGMTVDISARMASHRNAFHNDMRDMMRNHDQTLYVKILSEHNSRDDASRSEKSSIQEYYNKGAKLLNRAGFYKKERDWTKPLNQQTL